MKHITDEGLLQKNAHRIFYWCILWCLYGLCVSAIKIIQTSLSLRLQNKIKSHLYYEVFHKLERISNKFLSENTSTQLSSRLSADIDCLITVIESFATDYLFVFLQLCGGFLGILNLSYHLSLVVLFCIPIKIALLIVTARKKEKQTRSFITQLNLQTTLLGDIISGLSEIKLWNCTAAMHHRFERVLKKNLLLYRSLGTLNNFRDVLNDSIDLLLNCSIYIVAGVLMMHGKFTVGSTLAFMSYISYVLIPLKHILDLPYYIAGFKPSITRLNTFFCVADEPIYSLTPSSFRQADELSSNIDAFQDYIFKFENVSFSYPGEKVLFKHINLTVKKNDIIGIIGKNGVGKSTLVNLLLGFELPTSGQLLYKGKSYSINTVIQLRKEIAVVRQKSHLFNGTIKDNIDLLKNKSDQEIFSSCIDVGLKITNNEVQKILMQNLTNNGSTLSGGEHQKVILARELLKYSDIMIFDEPTKGLDENSKNKWMHLITQWKGKKTIIFITHDKHDLSVCNKKFIINNFTIGEF